MHKPTLFRSRAIVMVATLLLWHAFAPAADKEPPSVWNSPDGKMRVSFTVSDYFNPQQVASAKEWEVAQGTYVLKAADGKVLWTGVTDGNPLYSATTRQVLWKPDAKAFLILDRCNRAMCAAYLVVLGPSVSVKPISFEAAIAKVLRDAKDESTQSLTKCWFENWEVKDSRGTSAKGDLLVAHSKGHRVKMTIDLGSGELKVLSARDED